MTLTWGAFNWILQTRHQYDKHVKLNHLGQQYRCYHCRKNFRTKKDRISHAIIAHPNAPTKSFPPGILPQAIFGHRWNQLKLTPQPMSTTGHQRSKPTRLPIPRKHQHRDSQVSHCTHNLYIDDTCAVKLGPILSPHWCLDKTATIKFGHTFPMQGASRMPPKIVR